MGRKPVEHAALGEPFGIRRAFTKRFPLGQFSQTVAQAAMEARPFVTEPRRYRRGQHPRLAFRDQDHGRRAGQVEAADA